MKISSYILAMIVFVTILLCSCTGTRQQPTDQNLLQTPLSLLGTQTSTVLPIPATLAPLTGTFTTSPTPISTPTSTRTPTATATSTWTPLPTLPPQAAKEFVQELFETNRNCLLPCWWGVTPGQSSWGEAKQFLSQFAAVDPYGSVDQDKPKFYIGVLVPVPDEMFHDLFPDEKEVFPYFLQHIYEVEEEIVTSMEIFTGFHSSYSLSAFLQTYGPPTEIWLSTYSTEYPAGVLPFQAALFYPERGILAIYWPQQADFVGEFVRGCQWDKPPSMFGLWAPELNMTFLEAARHFRMNPDEPGFLLLPIEEATGMDPQTFFEMFSSPDNLACLETPKEFWPEQQ